MGEIVAAHAMLAFGVADNRFDGGPAAQVALDLFRHVALLAREIDLEAKVRRRVVAAVAAIDDEALKAGAGLRLEFGNHRRQSMAVVWIAGQRFDMGDELTALGAMDGRGQRDLHAELVGAMRLALADAFDLRRVQRINLPAALVSALFADPLGQP